MQPEQTAGDVARVHRGYAQICGRSARARNVQQLNLELKKEYGFRETLCLEGRKVQEKFHGDSGQEWSNQSVKSQTTEITIYFLARYALVLSNSTNNTNRTIMIDKNFTTHTG